MQCRCDVMVVESKERERISRQDRQAAGSVYNNIHTLWGRGTGQIIVRICGSVAGTESVLYVLDCVRVDFTINLVVVWRAYYS